jgi:ATP synthase F1 complex assembly factor 1
MLLRRVAARRIAAPLAAQLAAPRRGLAAGLAIPGTPRLLADVAKLDLLQAEEPARVGAIWDAFHDDKPSVAGCTVGPEDTAAMVERAAESPNFVFPLRREGGHFILFSQYAPAHKMFVLTFLEDYRRSPETAQPWASVHIFDDLVTTKGVGLLRAEVVPERLTTAEAEHLLLLTQRYYTTSSYDKPWTFNHAERHFDIEGYLATCP